MRLLKTHSSLNGLQVLSETDKDYLAYQVGLQLTADSSTATGSIQTAASGITVGTYDDTRFDTDLTTVITTSTTLYQLADSATELGIVKSNTPIVLNDSNTTKVLSKQNIDSDFNNIADDILSNIMFNEYPGTFRLGSSSPGADWTVHIADVFTDTRFNGENTAYNIYRRTSYSAPVKARPLVISYDDSDNPVGLEPITDQQIKDAFTSRVKNRILQTGVGKYQLRDDVQGVPTDPGTWATRGTATDTRNVTVGGVFTGELAFTGAEIYVNENILFTAGPFAGLNTIYTLDTFTNNLYVSATALFTGPGPQFYQTGGNFTGPSTLYTGPSSLFTTDNYDNPSLYTGSSDYGVDIDYLSPSDYTSLQLQFTSPDSEPIKTYTLYCRVA